MDREERQEWELIPEAEVMDYWEEGSEYIMYDGWDRIKDQLERIFRRQEMG